MAKVKYVFDEKRLEYIPLSSPIKLNLLSYTLFFVSSIIFGLIILFGFLNTGLLNTPKELLLERELKNYEFQFNILNRRLSQIQKVLSEIENRDNNIYRTYFEANPIPEEQRRAGFGGVNRYDKLDNFNSSEIIKETTRKLDILSKMLVVQSKSLDEIELLANNQEELLTSIPSIQPVKDKDLKRMASGYGWRIDPFTKTKKRHNGMDFSAKRGTPVYATGNGKVIRADNKSSGYGKHIRIDHGFGYTSLYAHLSKYAVRRNQTVKRGEIVGYVGNTGRSSGPHLHYEIIKDKRKVNPLNFYISNLSTEEFDAVIESASLENQSLD